MLTRTIEVRYKATPPDHLAPDPVDLADPLFRSMMVAERERSRRLYGQTPELTLAELVLKMRLAEASKR